MPEATVPAKAVDLDVELNKLIDHMAKLQKALLLSNLRKMISKSAELRLMEPKKVKIKGRSKKDYKFHQKTSKKNRNRQ